MNKNLKQKVLLFFVIHGIFASFTTMASPPSYRLSDTANLQQDASTDSMDYDDLDSYGDWVQDAEYGEVWSPDDVGPDWAPYQAGEWIWLDAWGWTWNDAQPWGFTPFHYGRWITRSHRWYWVPGPAHSYQSSRPQWNEGNQHLQYNQHRRPQVTRPVQSPMVNTAPHVKPAPTINVAPIIQVPSQSYPAPKVHVHPQVNPAIPKVHIHSDPQVHFHPDGQQRMHKNSDYQMHPKAPTPAQPHPFNSGPVERK